MAYILLAYEILLRRGLYPFVIHRLLIKRQHFYPVEASLPASHLIHVHRKSAVPQKFT